jgi:V/A-type H+/Na+-transporting ATPase subunit E
MPEEIRDLIEKINQEGIKAAGEKANSIEAEAQKKADAIISQARIEADRILSDAKDRIGLEDVRERALLAQAGRDLLLSLRKEINAMLGLTVVSDVRQALTPEALFRLLIEVVRNYNSAERSDITVSLNKKDLEILEKHYLDKLRQETEGDIVLKPGEEIRGGFTISFDREKSCYDFTDKALAEYIGTYLKPKLNKILMEAGEE